MKVFGCKCFIFNTKNNLDKFDPKSDEGISLGYSSGSKAYTIYNKRTLTIEESMHVNFDETIIKTKNPENEENIQEIKSLTLKLMKTQITQKYQKTNHLIGNSFMVILRNKLLKKSPRNIDQIQIRS